MDRKKGLADILCEDRRSGDDYHFWFVLKTDDNKTVVNSNMFEGVDNVIYIPTTRNIVDFLYGNPRIQIGGEYILLIDVPKVFSEEQWRTLLLNLEEIKQGFLYDFKGKEKIIEPPIICCFVNEMPLAQLLSNEKIKIYYG